MAKDSGSAAASEPGPMIKNTGLAGGIAKAPSEVKIRHPSPAGTRLPALLLETEQACAAHPRKGRQDL